MGSSQSVSPKPAPKLPAARDSAKMREDAASEIQRMFARSGNNRGGTILRDGPDTAKNYVSAAARLFS